MPALVAVLAAGTQVPAPIATSPVSAVSSGSRTIVIYELRLPPGSLAPGRIEVFDRKSAMPLARFDAAAIAARRGTTPDGIGLVYLELDLPAASGSRMLSHTIDGVDGPILTIDPRPALRLFPPLAGGPWVAVHAPDWPRGHRRVAREGGSVPGRYAVDFVGTDGTGRTTRGDPDRPAEAIGYGAPVFAGVDAVVAAVRSDMAEHPGIASNPAHDRIDAAGNYVALRLPDGRHVFYEHLKPASVTVRPGQRVTAGMPIGAVGFTGDTTGPHLHIHVAAGSDPWRAEGLPFVIDAFEEIGRYADIAALGKARWSEDHAIPRGDAWPASNTVVRFRGR